MVSELALGCWLMNGNDGPSAGLDRRSPVTREGFVAARTD